MISWKDDTPSAFKDGPAVGYADHGQYWPGWESGDTQPSPKAPVWFVVYKPYGGAPVVI
jgi:hypothetical protein